MTLLIGAWTIGLVLSLLALGVFISFRIFHFPDITADGSITLGASVAAVLLVNGTDPLLATSLAFVGGALAGATTGVLHTKFQIHKLLSGILVMTALYSVNLHVMGKSNVPLLSETTLATLAANAGATLLGGAESVFLWGWEISTRDASVLSAAFLAAVVTGAILYVFFRTNLGTAMRGTGDNNQMVRALGISDGEHDDSRTRVVERAHRRFRCASGAVPRLRRRSNGNRHGSLGAR